MISIHMFFVYMVTNKPQGTLYIGHTDDLARRVWEHQAKVFKGFTGKYNLDKLVWYEAFPTRDAAFTHDRRMKFWKRAWKIKLIEENNPEWRDLSREIGWM